MSKVTLQKETLKASQVLTLKRVEKRTSKQGEEYYRLVFDMCLNDGADNPRDVNCVDVPLYVTKDLLSERLKGIKPAEMVNRLYRVDVEFMPYFNFKEGVKYVNWREEIIEIEEVI